MFESLHPTLFSGGGGKKNCAVLMQKSESVPKGLARIVVSS